MTFPHEAIAACPVLTNADKALIRAMTTRRFAYCLAASESATNFIAVDPASGVLPLYILQNNIIFQYDSTDSTSVHDGVTCLVTSDGKRYKSPSVAYPWSVLSKNTSAQPGSPTVGDRYLIPTAATGAAWSGQDNKVGIYTAAGWFFATIPIGRFLYVEDEGAFYHRNASGTWTAGVGAISIAADSVRPSNIIGKGLRWHIENQTTNTPPGSVSVGVAYIIGPSPTGAWAGNTGKIAICEVVNTFTIYTPRTGEVAYDKALTKDVRYNGSAWFANADAMVLIATQLASASATIDFVNGATVGGLVVVLDDTYDCYELVIDDLKPTTDDTFVYLRVGTGAGPTWQATGYQFNNEWNGTNLNASAAIAMILTKGTAGGPDVGNAAGESFCAVIRFSNPEVANFPKFTWLGHYDQANAVNAIASIVGAGRWNTASAITGVRIVMNSGTIAGGRFSLFGRRKS